MPAWLWGPVHRAQSSLPPELCVAAELHWLLRTLTSSLRAASARLPKHPRMIYPPTARAVAILRHHHAGARHAPPARLIDEPGVAHTSRPPRATTTQPTHRLLSVDGRRPLDAALEAVLDVCQAAELGCSVAALWTSSPRPPCPCLVVRRGPGRPAPEVRTAVGRRGGRPPLPGWSARTHSRAGGALESLGKL